MDPPPMVLPSLRMLLPHNNMILRRFAQFANSAAAPLLHGAAPSNSRSLCGASGACDPGTAALAHLLRSIALPSAHAAKTPLPDYIPAEDHPLLKEESSLPARHGPLRLRYPAADRIVAIGDVHGDARALHALLRSAGVLSENGEWAGGRTVLVQVGDVLDRGSGEREIFSTLFRLQDAAPAAGGAVHILLGNHEVMNSVMDFRYVTRGGFLDFGNAKKREKDDAAKRERARTPKAVRANIRALPSPMRARARALAPGGPLAAELATRAQVAVIVGDSVFVHAGLQPAHFSGPNGKPPSEPVKALAALRSLNARTREYLLGRAPPPNELRTGSGPVWMRDYSRHALRASSAECRMLADTLKLVRAKRMVVGHTPQAGINSACAGRVWRVDTGMSAAYGGVPEALEISRAGRVKIHTLDGPVQGSARYK